MVMGCTIREAWQKFRGFIWDKFGKQSRLSSENELKQEPTDWSIQPQKIKLKSLTKIERLQSIIDY